MLVLDVCMLWWMRTWLFHAPYKKDLEPWVNLLPKAVLESFMSAFLLAGVIKLEWTWRSLSLSNGLLSWSLPSRSSSYRQTKWWWLPKRDQTISYLLSFPWVHVHQGLWAVLLLWKKQAKLSSQAVDCHHDSKYIITEVRLRWKNIDNPGMAQPEDELMWNSPASTEHRQWHVTVSAHKHSGFNLSS